jgi:hypothetical protein
VKTISYTLEKAQETLMHLNKCTFKTSLHVPYIESCKTLYITGKIDEAEGTSVVAEIENLLCAATVEQQLHILKDVSNFLSTTVIKYNDYVKREDT